MKVLALSFGALIVTAALIAGMFASGFGFGGPDSGADLNVTLREWSISPKPLTLAAGDIAIEAKNNGTEEHELVFIRTDLAPDRLPVAADKVDEEKVQSPGEIEEIKPRETKSGTITLGAGHYVLICNLPTHYSQGMRAEITVR